MSFSLGQAMKKKEHRSAKKRILMLYDFPIKGGGSGAYVKYLSMRLQDARRYEIAIAAPDKEEIDPSVKQYTIKLPQIPVFIGRPGLEKSKRYKDLTSKEIADLYTIFLQETIKIIEDFKPDLIHVHHMLVNAWVADFIRGIYGVKYIVTCHGSDLFAVAEDKRYFRKTREALRAADAITVVSGDTRAKLLSMFGQELKAKTRTIPGGIRLNLFPERMDRKSLADLAGSLNLTGKKIALFTGRLINEKGIDYLVKAASKIKGDVIIAGDGPQKKRLEKMIKDLHLLNVLLLGHFDYQTLIKLYYLADVFVSPAVWDEPLGLTIIEAMAASKPVVVTRRGGVTMAVKDGQNGFFVRSRNAKDIAEKINGLFANPVQAEKMGRKARTVVVERFTWGKIAKRFDTLYTKFA
jgi:glycosyltransferase involved in cell wall biosynthesis